MQERPSRRGPHWVPSVNPAELRKVWNFWRDFEAHHPGAGVGRALAEIERGLTSDPNYWASYRAAMLYMMTFIPMTHWVHGVADWVWMTSCFALRQYFPSSG